MSPLLRELRFGVLAFDVLAAGDPARTPGEEITLHAGGNDLGRRAPDGSRGR